MTKPEFVMFFCLLSVLGLFVSLSYGAANENREVSICSLFKASNFKILFGLILVAIMMMIQTYIVYMGSLPKGEYFPAAHHVTMLQDVVGDR